ncbi:hypothetical protein BGW41_004970 [Actinomortierella wolfii]|nr:hypothetical protein BGW41_004970 [Actinomortierella wolfii]
MHRPSRLQDQHDVHDTLGSQIESSRSSEGGGQNDQSGGNPTPTPGSIHREGNGNDSGGIPGTIEDQESNSIAERSTSQEMQLDGPGDVDEGSEEEPRMVEDSLIGMRQHNNVGAYQQVRRDTISTPSGSGHTDMGALHRHRDAPHYDLRPITTQPGRRPIQKNDYTARVVHQEVVLSASRGHLERAPDRPICNSSKRQGPSIYITEAGGDSLESRRIQQRLVTVDEGVRVSTLGSHQQSVAEDQTGQGQGHSHHSLLEERALVPYDHGHDNEQADTDSSERRVTSTRKRSTHPGQKPDVVTDSMERRRQQAISQGAGAGVLAKLFDSKAARSKYKRRGTGQQAFISWMQVKGRDPLNPTAMDIMNFLDYGLEDRKWRLNTLLTYKSAILQLLPVEQQQRIMEDEMFKDFLKMMSAGTCKRLRNSNLDLQPVMEALQAMSDNHSMSIKDLTVKTCFLLAMCGLLRPDDLACADAERSKVDKDKAYVEYRRRTSDQDRFARGKHHKLDSEPFTPLIRQVKRTNLPLGTERISKYIKELLQLIPREEGSPPYKARAGEPQ